MLKISRVTKLDGIVSWSLPSLTTCPGARKPSGDVVDVCKFCYARQGHYRMPNVKDAREHNREDWLAFDWVDRMRARLSIERYFRWFDSGDIYRPALALKILLVVQGTPWCQHWIPTRSHKIDRIRPILEQINAEPNAVVRYSGDAIDGSDDLAALAPHASIVVPSEEDTPDGVHFCPAYRTKPAKCNGCRACWDKDVAVIAYPLHGSKIKEEVA